MVKVLEILCEPISNGGQEAFVMNVYNNINMDDLQIDLFTPYYCDNDYYKKQVEARGGRIICAGKGFRPGKSRLFYIKMLLKFFEKHPYDVAHIHSGSITALAYCAYAAKKSGVKKVIVHSHCGVEKITLKNRIICTYASVLFNKYADQYCACSKEAAIAKYSKEILGKVKYLKNGVDLNKFKVNENIRMKTRCDLGIANDEFLVGHVGRFSYQKNHDRLIDIFVEVKKTTKCKLLLIGTGELYDDIKERVNREGLEDSVVFLGNVNDVHNYMQAMDCFVLPSRYEGLPIVGVEAQAAGLPVITSDGVSQELKICNDVCFLSLDDVDKWCDKILECINTNKKDNSSILISAGYDINSTAENVRDMYCYWI